MTLRLGLWLCGIFAVSAAVVWFVPYGAYGVMGAFFIWQVVGVTYEYRPGGDLDQRGRATRIALNTGTPYKEALRLVQTLDLLRERRGSR